MKKISIVFAALTAFIAAFVLFIFTDGYAVHAENSESDIVTVDADGYKDAFVFDDTDKTTLKSFVMPDTVTGKFKIVIPSSAKTVASKAIDGTSNAKLADNLVGIEFTGTVVIEERVVENCREIATLTLNDGLTFIGNEAFADTKIQVLSIPESVTYIGVSAFTGNTALASIDFAGGPLTVSRYAFAGCSSVRFVYLPDDTTVIHQAFYGCSSLLWVYTGRDCEFINNMGCEYSPPFFPTDTDLRIIYPSKSEYDKMKSSSAQTTFRDIHGAKSTYIVPINYYIGDDETPSLSCNRLKGEKYNFVCNDETGAWSNNDAFNDLYVQADHYRSTVWYSERTLESVMDVEKVNEKLAVGESIDLFCHYTVARPTFPKNVSWVYDSKKSYDIKSLSSVLKAMGSKDVYTDSQLASMKFEITYKDADSKSAATPDKIGKAGTYSLGVMLDPKYGVWDGDGTATSKLSINVDTGSFGTILIIFAVIGGIAIAATVSTAVIRKKVQAKNRRKQISAKDAIRKFKTVGGETTLEE